MSNNVFVFIFVVCSLDYAETQLVQAIQRAYNLDSPPVVKVERGVVTVSEATTLVCCVVLLLKTTF